MCALVPDAGADASTRDAAGPDSGPRDAGRDAGGDAGTDAGRDAGRDAGPTFPSHCFDRALETGVETDIDCGGPCPACLGCRRCLTAADCASGPCRAEGVCTPALSSVTTTAGSRMAYVREDGAILLAYYAPSAFITSYDPGVNQIANGTGGAVAPGAGWAPDPCIESGHLRMGEFDPAGAALEIQCGTSYDSIAATVSSSTLFDDFRGGVKGSVGTVGSPGWGAIAGMGTPDGRQSTGMCGSGTSTMTGGIAYCDGPSTGSPYQNHLASYTIVQGRSDNPFVGCNRSGGSRMSFSRGVWVWLRR
ncbi:MAG: hypothetical protein IT378_08495 [Sandaracinaceae bacterium]|nr:hypothetical protein [Sandaracinaceae bacterium]